MTTQETITQLLFNLTAGPAQFNLIAFGVYVLMFAAITVATQKVVFAIGNKF